MLLQILYFFFKDTREQKWLNTAICAVLHQLLLNDNPLVSRLQSEITQAGAKLTDNLSSLWKLFSTACACLPGGIICVFDALDECDPKDCLLLIKNIQCMLKPGDEFRVIRFLITTRGYPRLLRQFKEYESGLIHLDGDGKQEKDAIQQEISLVLDYKLDHLFTIKGLNQQYERKAALEEALRLKGSQQRTYLWLKLVFDFMERIPWKSDSDWRKVIVSPPQSVNEAYAALLQNVSEEEKEYVKTLLHLMVAARRPLTLREMVIALIVRDSPGADDEKSLELQSDGEFKDWIIQSCGFFVTVYDNELYFIHQTAKEFLVDSGPGTPWPQALDRFFPVTDSACHKFMAESSVAYLSLKCFRSAPFQERVRRYRFARSDQTGRRRRSLETSIYEEYQFLDYITEYWATHFRLCQSVDGTNFSDIGDAFAPYYITVFVTSDCLAPGWMYLKQQSIFKGPADLGLDLSRSYNLCDAAIWFDHVRLLAHSLHHEACIREFLLHTAAGLDSVGCVQYLAATATNINAQDSTGATALCFATNHRAAQAANVLLDYHADVNLGAKPDALPLSYIAEHYEYTPEYEKLLRRVVHQGADLNKPRFRRSKDGMMTLLAWAAVILRRLHQTRKLDTWIRGILSSSSPEIVADSLESLNLFATERFLAEYNSSLVKFLLDHGAHIDGDVSDPLFGSEGFRSPVTALEYACFYGGHGLTYQVFWNALFLLHAGANSQLNSETGRSAFDWLLLAPWEKSATGRFHAARLALSGQVHCRVLAAIILKQNPASGYINDPISTKTMQTRLHSMIGVNINRREKVKLLLDHGAVVNCQDSCGKTPMHHLVSLVEDDGQSDRLDVMEILITGGADLQVRDSLGRTPMHHVRSAHVIDMLVRYGADIEARDQQGNTPLQSLLESGSSDVQNSVAHLIETGADLTVTNSKGETIFHTAARSGLALKYDGTGYAGVDLESEDKEGRTPLQAALDHRSHETAALLLRSGANPDPLLMVEFDVEQRDKKTSATLLAFVSKYHARDAVRILLARGADSNSFSNGGIVDVATLLNHVNRDNKTKKGQGLNAYLALKRAEKQRGHFTWTDSDWGGESPLHLAMHARWTCDAETTVDLLLRYGAEIESKSIRDETPLQVAFA